jgi:hypothetical protein
LKPEVLKEKKGLLKSKTKLSRMYMIDIFEHGKKEIEVLMHFVNKNYNPMEAPKIKRYRMSIDSNT